MFHYTIFLGILLCSMLHCKKFVKALFLLGSQVTYQQVVCFGLFFFCFMVFLSLVDFIDYPVFCEGLCYEF